MDKTNSTLAQAFATILVKGGLARLILFILIEKEALVVRKRNTREEDKTAS